MQFWSCFDMLVMDWFPPKCISRLPFWTKLFTIWLTFSDLATALRELWIPNFYFFQKFIVCPLGWIKHKSILNSIELNMCGSSMWILLFIQNHIISPGRFEIKRFGSVSHSRLFFYDHLIILHAFSWKYSLYYSSLPVY